VLQIQLFAIVEFVYTSLMNSKKHSGLLSLIICLSATIAIAQQDFSKVQIKATKVAGSVHMLEGAGGNIGVSVGENGIVIVDDQFAPLAAKIKEAFKRSYVSMSICSKQLARSWLKR